LASSGPIDNTVGQALKAFVGKIEAGV